ncbi:homeobox protein orthopedia B [Lates japonicus]|uniref:Homeobox protein orthopedia B n=1 Tax=Lates japonicus TaxID=270547 RepID=A0AAD3NLA5_LATJO|nr:homeobox protein orthopedia B [Lates japonicus]
MPQEPWATGGFEVQARRRGDLTRDTRGEPGLGPDGVEGPRCSRDDISSGGGSNAVQVIKNRRSSSNSSSTKQQQPQPAGGSRPRNRSGTGPASPGAAQRAERSFCQNVLPRYLHGEELLLRIESEESRVQVWFQNRRAKWKKRKKTTNVSGSGTSCRRTTACPVPSAAAARYVGDSLCSTPTTPAGPRQGCPASQL